MVLALEEGGGAIASFSFEKRNKDELTIQFNDLVTVLSLSCGVEGWCGIERNGEKGLVPSAYLKPLPTPYEGIKGRAIFPFTHESEANTGQFLQFDVGDEIIVVDRPNTGWCIGIQNNHVGLYPEGYVTFNDTSTFSQIEKLLTIQEGDEFRYARILCSSVDVSSTENVARDMVLVFEKQNKVYEFICSVIDREIEQTINEGTLFRKNSISSYLMSQYARLVAKDYLCQVIKPLVRKIIDGKADFEIDPHKIEATANLERNQEALERATQNFLHDLMSSVSKFPMVLKRICLYLQKRVILRFPKAKRKVVGGFFFLRLICPAVVSPDGFGIVESVDNESRRCLVLISKIIQTLSNGVMFGIKEEYMIPMNRYIKDNLENSHFILDKLVGVHPDIPSERLQPLTEEEVVKSSHRLHLAISLCRNKFFKNMRAENVPEEFLTNVLDLVLRLGPTPQREVKKVVNRPSLSRGQSDSKAIRTKPSKEVEKKKVRKRGVSSVTMPAPSGTILIKSPITWKQGKQWRKRTCALYSVSTKVFVYANQDDPPTAAIDAIELAPTFEVTLTGRTKQGWEFSVRTLRTEYFFSSNEEKDMRSWVAYLDRRKREIMMPEDDKRNKMALVECLEQKMEGYVADRQATKEKLKNTDDAAVRLEHTRHIEELIICMETLQRSIVAAKDSLR